MRKIPILIIFVILFHQYVFGQNLTKQIKEFDAYAEKSMNEQQHLRVLQDYHVVIHSGKKFFKEGLCSGINPQAGGASKKQCLVLKNSKPISNSNSKV